MTLAKVNEEGLHPIRDSYEFDYWFCSYSSDVVELIAWQKLPLPPDKI